MQDIWGNTGHTTTRPPRSKAPISKKSNHYDVLGVPVDATSEMIREAFLRSKQMYNIDSAAFYSLMSQDEMADHREQLNKAFEVLGDHAQRVLYHKEMNLPLLGLADQVQENDHSQYQAQLQKERLSNLRIGESEVVGLGIDEAQWTSKSESTEPAASGNTRPMLRQIPKVAPTAKRDGVQFEMSELIGRSDLGDGALYRSLRELAGVSEAEIQDRTKISLEYIQAMENNRFERLPQAVYIRGFLRSYLRYIHAPNPDQMVKAFSERFETWEKGQKR